jgi:hypothetical protein
MAAKRSVKAIPAPTNGGIVINAASILSGAYRILVSIGTAILLYVVTSWISTSKENAKKQSDVSLDQTTKLNAIQTYALPTMQKSIEVVQADVKEVNNGLKDANKELQTAKSVMITRDELTNKNSALQNSIKEVKDSVHDVTVEQSKVRDALLNSTLPSPKPYFLP